MKSHLKVKVCSLSMEMTYIRRLEEKWKTKARIARQKAKDTSYHESNFWSLRHHRNDLKVAARTTHLAYGAMRGVPYSKMEFISLACIKGYNRAEPDWAGIEATVDRFSKDEPNQQDIMQKFAEWVSDAKAWYEANPQRIEKARDVRKTIYEAQRNNPEYQREKALRATYYQAQIGKSAAGNLVGS